MRHFHVSKQPDTSKYAIISTKQGQSKGQSKAYVLQPSAASPSPAQRSQHCAEQRSTGTLQSGQADLLLRKAKVPFAQIEQDGLGGSVEPPADLVLGQARAQTQQISGDGAAQACQHQGSQQLVLHADKTASFPAFTQG